MSGLNRSRRRGAVRPAVVFALSVTVAACGAGAGGAGGAGGVEPPAPVAARTADQAPAARPATAPSPTLAPDLEKRVIARNGVVSAAHPLAAEAGVEMLRRGGNAVDAAVATAFAIGVVEPMMSGVGGGGGMLIWLQEEGRAEYVDFYSASRATAWRGALPDTGTASLRDVGVPGAVAGLLEAHERFGRLSRAEVLEPAIRLAEEGFPMYIVLADAIRANRPKLERFPEAARRFLPNGEPPPLGSTFRQPELATTLRKIAEHGKAGFYEGDVARAVVAVMNAGGNPTTLADFAAYTPRWNKRPICTTYRGRIVLSAPPPQTGMHIAHALNLLERHDLARLGLPTRSAEAFHVLASALRVAVADHSRHNNDPNWAPVPAAGMASKAFAASRAALVGAGGVPERVEPGDAAAYDRVPPPAACEPFEPYGPAREIRAEVVGASRLASFAAHSASAAPRAVAGDAGMAGVRLGDLGVLDHPEGETTHLSVVDRDGNAVALSNTLSPYFGSGAWVAGFFLNSSAVDFSRSDPMAPARSEWRVRNSTISPTIVLEDGRVGAVIGAPGGGRIPGSVIQGLVFMLDYGMDPLEAVRMPRIFPSANSRHVEIEHGYPGDVLGRVRALGWEPGLPGDGYARLYVVARVGDVWVGAADPRHDGAARGY